MDTKEYKKSIKGMLGKIVPEHSNEIMKGLYPEKIRGYSKGEIYKFNEISDIKKGDVIFFKYWNDEDRLNYNDFGVVNALNKFGGGYYVLSGGWEFEFREKDLDKTDEVNRIDNSGWHFSIYKAIKK